VPCCCRPCSSWTGRCGLAGSCSPLAASRRCLLLPPHSN
ncbi:hypothetical protein LSH36_782g05055, partial [Paralvinella palmiformis]